MSADEQTAGSVRKLLVTVSVEQILREQRGGDAGGSSAEAGASTAAAPLTLLRSTATVSQALTAFAQRRIMSAPVVVPEAEPSTAATADPNSPTWPGQTPAADTLGFVDIRDILCSFLHEVRDQDLVHMKLLHLMRVLEEEGRKFGAKQLSALHVMGFDGGFMHCSQSKTCLLEFCMHGLLNPKTRGMHEGSHSVQVVHRIAFFDNTGSVQSIVSQTDLIRFLAQHLEELGPISRMTLEQLGMVRNPVQSVLPETSAIAALSQMQEKGLSALAVVNRNGQLIGNFSVSDLRCILPHQFGALALPVGEFLALEHRTEYVGSNRVHDEGVAGTQGHRFVQEMVARKHPHVPGEDVGQALVLSSPSDTLGQVLTKLASHRIHRLYVVDRDEKPVSIVTLTDVLRRLVEESTRPAAGGSIAGAGTEACVLE